MLTAKYVVESIEDVDTPCTNCINIFFLTTDSKFYAMFSDRSTVELSSGILSNNIIIPANEGNLQLSSLETILYGIQLSDDIIFTSTNFPNLITIQAAITLRENAITGIIDFSQLTSCPILSIDELPLLTELRIPSLENINSLAVTDCETLNNVSIKTSGVICSEFLFSGNALIQNAVDDIILSAVNGNQNNGRLDISGGTSSPPSAGGAANLLVLQARGWAVTTN